MGKFNLKLGEYLTRLGYLVGSRRIDAALKMYLQGRDGASCDAALNGEFWLIRTMTQLDARVFVDVGANRGVWSREVLRQCPGSELHAFEPNPALIPHLNALFEASSTAFLNPCGLSHESGEVDIKIYPDDGWSTMISGLSVHDEYGYRVVRCPIDTLSNYVSNRNIDTIDLMKIDVEGAEHWVLRGAEDLLQARRIRVIQFEYGYANAETRFLMKDFYELFLSYGYTVGKLTRSGVHFRPYDYRLDNFESGPNYVAALSNDAMLIKST